MYGQESPAPYENRYVKPYKFSPKNTRGNNMKKTLVCKNVHCPYGDNGQPKVYQYCVECNTIFKWKEYACCIECYEQYQLSQLREQIEKQSGQ